MGFGNKIRMTSVLVKQDLRGSVQGRDLSFGQKQSTKGRLNKLVIRSNFTIQCVDVSEDDALLINSRVHT